MKYNWLASTSIAMPSTGPRLSGDTTIPLKCPEKVVWMTEWRVTPLACLEVEKKRSETGIVVWREEEREEGKRGERARCEGD